MDFSQNAKLIVTDIIQIAKKMSALGLGRSEFLYISASIWDEMLKYTPEELDEYLSSLKTSEVKKSID